MKHVVSIIALCLLGFLLANGQGGIGGKGGVGGKGGIGGGTSAAGVTWTLSHHTTNFACTTPPCVTTIPQIAAGHAVLILSSVFYGNGSVTLNTPTLSGETFTHCPSQYADQNYSGLNHSIADCYYLLSAAGGGGTSLSVPWSNADNVDVDVLDIVRSTGSATLETCGGGGATACTSLNSNIACTSCNGPTPTVTSNPDFVASWNANENDCTAVASPFNTAPSPDVDNSNVFGLFSWSLSQSSGNPAVYTCTSGKLGMSAIALK